MYTHNENALQAAWRCVHLRGAARAGGARGPRIDANCCSDMHPLGRTHAAASMTHG